MKTISRRFMLHVGLLPLAAGLGCRNVWKDDAPAGAVQTAPEPTRIIYRTRTDRLNVAGGKLPACSIATLHIEAPHPELKSDYARATVVIERCTADANPYPSRGLSGAIATYFNDDTSPSSTTPASIWSADVPLWQMEAIVGPLENAKFFDRQRTVLDPEVFLSIEKGPLGVGKKYRSVAELDVLLMRVVADELPPAAGQAAVATSTAPNTRSELARLPTI